MSVSQIIYIICMGRELVKWYKRSWCDWLSMSDVQCLRYIYVIYKDGISDFILVEEGFSYSNYSIASLDIYLSFRQKV